jgi:hypothetical protein
MALTLNEIKDRLKRLDEVDLLEVLEISSEDLVERFTDYIEDRVDELEQELED